MAMVGGPTSSATRFLRRGLDRTSRTTLRLARSSLGTQGRKALAPFGYMPMIALAHFGIRRSRRPMLIFRIGLIHLSRILAPGTTRMYQVIPRRPAKTLYT